MEPRKIDMHIHTKCSNGSEDLPYVLTDAQRNGVSTISIVDFNTLEPYFMMEHMDVKQYYTGTIITGTEVNCNFDHFCSDMLAYDIKDKVKLQNWLNQNTGRDNTKEAQMEQLEHYKQVAKELMLHFDETLEVNEKQPYAGKVFANDLAQYPENRSKVEGIEKPSNFWVEHCLNINSPFYFDMSRYRPSLQDFLKIVHECGGLVFAAHPFAYAHSKEALWEYLNLCKQEGVDGIECYQCYNEDVAYATEMPIEFCKKNGLYMSGGTDFHKRSGDPRYSGVGRLGSDTIKNYLDYIPEELVLPWINRTKTLDCEVETSR